MLEITDLAIKNLKSYMSENNVDSAVRVALMQGGWAGPSLGLALDEPKGNDEVVEKDGIKFLLDKELSQNCGVIKVDFIEAGYRSGFAISSANPIGGGASCGSSCGTGGSCGC